MEEGEQHRFLTNHLLEVREFWTDHDVKVNMHLGNSKFVWKETRKWICQCGEEFKEYRKVYEHILMSGDIAQFFVYEVLVPLKARELTR